MILSLISCFNAADIAAQVDRRIAAATGTYTEGPVAEFSDLSYAVRNFFNNRSPVYNNTYRPRDSGQVRFSGRTLNGVIVSGELTWRDCEHRIGRFLGMGGYREYTRQNQIRGNFNTARQNLRERWLREAREAQSRQEQARIQRDQQQAAEQARLQREQKEREDAACRARIQRAQQQAAQEKIQRAQQQAAEQARIQREQQAANEALRNALGAFNVGGNNFNQTFRSTFR